MFSCVHSGVSPPSPEPSPSITRVYCLVAYSPPGAVAFTVNVNVPASSGVPITLPFSCKSIPSGSFPDSNVTVFPAGVEVIASLAHPEIFGEYDADNTTASSPGFTIIPFIFALAVLLIRRT